MKCHEVKFMMPEYAEDRLETKKKNEVESHLEVCPACREEFAEVANLFDFAAHAIPGKSEAPKGYFETVWPKLEHRIHEERLDIPLRSIFKILMRKLKNVMESLFSPRMVLQSRPALAGLSLVFVLAIITGIYTLRPLTHQDKIRIQEEAFAELERTEQDYLAAIKRFSNVLEEQRDEIDPELYQLYTEKLDVLDSYIDDCKVAINENRYNVHVRQYLLMAYSEKKDTLEKMVQKNGS